MKMVNKPKEKTEDFTENGVDGGKTCQSCQEEWKHLEFAEKIGIDGSGRECYSVRNRIWIEARCLMSNCGEDRPDPAAAKGTIAEMSQTAGAGMLGRCTKRQRTVTCVWRAIIGQDHREDRTVGMGMTMRTALQAAHGLFDSRGREADADPNSERKRKGENIWKDLK